MQTVKMTIVSPSASSASAGTPGRQEDVKSSKAVSDQFYPKLLVCFSLSVIFLGSCMKVLPLGLGTYMAGLDGGRLNQNQRRMTSKNKNMEEMLPDVYRNRDWFHMYPITEETKVIRKGKDGKIKTIHFIPPPMNQTDATAVLHIGPMKTGSTAIQTMFPLLRDVLPKDNYEILNYNLMRERHRQAINFVSCFIKDNHSGNRRLRAEADQSHRQLLLAKDMNCHKESLSAALDIAKRGHNMLISAEYLGIPKRDVKELRDFLKPWKKVEVIAYYRRYFDWIISFTNQYQTEQPVPERITIIDFVKEKMAAREDPLDKWYTVGYVKRFKEYFDNVKVYNIHSIPDGDAREQFYCEALPNAPNACREVRAKKATDEVEFIHQSRAVVYENLAYHAMQMGLWSERFAFSIRDATLAAEKRQEKVLGLTSYDFDGKICPDDEMINWLREKSWEAERQLFPVYFEEKGKKAIAEEIEKVRHTKLCHIDVKEVLKDRKWQQFFKDL